jgi:Uma2 family endonuclease
VNAGAPCLVKQKFLPLCPDFVVELCSPTDNPRALQDKMQEYIDNGAQLGWLIDQLTRRVHIYRPQRPPEILEAPNAVSADPLLPDFALDLQTIWAPDL